MTTKTVTIVITTNPLDTAIIALEMRRFLMRSTPAFVWDNCGEGSKEQPRRLTAEFPAVVRDSKVAEH